MWSNNDFEVLIGVFGKCSQSVVHHPREWHSAGDELAHLDPTFGQQAHRLRQILVVVVLHRADETFFAQDDLERAEWHALGVDADQHDAATFASYINGQVGGVWGAGTFEHDIRPDAAARVSDRRDGAGLGGVEAGGRAKLDGQCAAPRVARGRTPRWPQRLERPALPAGRWCLRRRRRPSRRAAAPAAYPDGVRSVSTDQSAFLVGQAVRQADDGGRRDDRELGQAAIGHQAERRPLHAQRVLVAAAEEARAAEQHDLGHDALADTNAADAFTQGLDGAGELVAEGNRGGAAGQEVRYVGGDDGRAGEILLDVGAADAAPGNAQQQLAGPG